MPATYLDWLVDLFDEAQVPYNEDTADYLDQALRRIAKAEGASDEEVYRKLRDTWLRHGRSGRQLLASFLRDQVYARRDSPIRPVEGSGHYVNPDLADEIKGRRPA
jgi:hypothetical protein